MVWSILYCGFQLLTNRHQEMWWLDFSISSSDHWIVSWMELRNLWNSWTSSKKWVHSRNVSSAFHAQSHVRPHLGRFLIVASIWFSSITSAAVLESYWVVLPLGAFCLRIHSQGEMDLPLHFKGFRNYSYRVVKECVDRFIGIGENLMCTSLRQVGYGWGLSNRVELSRTWWEGCFHTMN